MKKPNLFFYLIITLLIFSCSSDENTSTDQEQEQNLKLYKKTEAVEEGSISGTQEVFYNSNFKIESISFFEENFLNRTYEITYSADMVTGIIVESDYINPNATDVTTIYNNITNGINSTILCKKRT